MCKNQEQIRQIRLKLNLTQEELAKKLQISKQYLCSIEKGVKKLPQQKFDILMQLYKDSPVSAYENCVEMELIGAEFTFDEQDKVLKTTGAAHKVCISSVLLDAKSKKEKYAAIKFTSDSMEPTIEAGSTVVIRYCEFDSITDNSLYAFYYENKFFIRRLAKNLSELIVTADNKNYGNFVLSQKDLKKIQIVGKIVAVAFC